MAEVSELFTLVDADAVGRVDVPCKDETGMRSDKYTCFTDLARWLSECVALSFDATCLEDASTLTAREKNHTQFRFFVLVSLRLRMHYGDNDPSGTAPKSTLYETEPGLSVESTMAVFTCWHFSSQPFMFHAAGACAVQKCSDLRVHAFR